MKEILITSSVLILSVIILRLLFRTTVSRRLIYGAWLLVALRLMLLGCCAVAMRRDAAMVRARQRRRARLARELHLALNPLHEVPAARVSVPVRAGAQIA